MKSDDLLIILALRLGGGMGWQGIIVGLGGLVVLGVGCAGAVPSSGDSPAAGRTKASRALVITEIDQSEVVNRPPRFLSLAPAEAREGSPYTYDFRVQDPDGDDVRFALVEAPEGVTLEGRHLTWVPRPAQVGRRQTFTLRAVDEHGAARDQIWQVVPRGRSLRW
jgi:hypothetical protein